MARSDVYAVYVWEARVRNGQTQPFAEAVASPLPAADVRCPTWLHLSRHLEARSSVVSLMLTLQLQAARLILAGVFLTSGASKLVSSESTVEAVREYQFLPRELSWAAGSLLPVVELAAGAACLLGVDLVITSMGLVILLGAFTVAVATNLIRRRRVRCHCFGGSHALIGPHTLVRNAVLIGLSAFLGVASSKVPNRGVGQWHGAIALVSNADVAVPLLAASVLGLAALFLIGEADTTVLHASRERSIRD